MNAEQLAEAMNFEHSHGHHLVLMEAECTRCRAGELPTQSELARAIIERDAQDRTLPVWAQAEYDEAVRLSIEAEYAEVFEKRQRITNTVLAEYARSVRESRG